MRGFVEFQDEFYRAYVKLRYKTENIQRLTVDERERLEFVFKIENNCTKGIADESDTLNTILEHIDKIFLDMSDEAKLIGLAVLVFAYTGYKVFEKYSDNKVKGKELDAGNNALRIQKDAIVEAIAASNHVPQLAREFEHKAESAFRSVFKGAAGATEISIGNESFDEDEIAEIIKKPERIREKREISIQLFIDGIRRNRGYYTLNVIDADEHAFSIKADFTMVNDQEKEQLFDAFRKEISLKLTFTAVIVDGEICSGNFIEVAPKA